MTVGLSTTGVANKCCATCGESYPTEGFYPNNKRNCKSCVKVATNAARRARYAKDRAPWLEEQRQRRAANPERFTKHAQRKNLEAKGLSLDDFEALLAAQDGRCAICNRDEPGGRGTWHVDHDHRCCGRKKACKKCVRGLLCARCNIGLGYLGDSADTLIAATAYLMQNGSTR